MDCVLCYELFDESQYKPYSINPCGHYFCKVCLDKIKNNKCPTCRGNIQSKTLNRGILDLINPEKLIQDGKNDNINNKNIRLLKHSLIEEVENLLNEWKTKKENEIQKIKLKIKSLVTDIEKDKLLKIAKIEADSLKIINRLNHVENVFNRDIKQEIEAYALNVKMSQENIKNSSESKLALQHADILKEEIRTKSVEIRNLEEFWHPFIYLSNFNGENAIGNIVKSKNDGIYVLIK